MDFDDDNDGVDDIYDLCPETPQGDSVDADGCTDESNNVGDGPNDDLDNDGVNDSDEILGCTDSDASNYDPQATEDDNSCVLSDDEDSEGASTSDSSENKILGMNILHLTSKLLSLSK